MKRILCVIILLCLMLGISVGCAAKTEPEAAASLPDRQTATYAVLVGTISEKYVDEQFPNAKKLPFDSINDAVLALLSDKADYVVSAYTNCLNFVRANPDKLTVLPDELTSEGCAVAVNKSETELLKEIDRVLEQFRGDGTLERVISNWIREDGSAYVRDEIPVLSDAPALHVAVSAEREPMCFVEDGKVVGLDAELIQRIAYELGMRVEFSDMKFSAIIPSVLSGKTPVAVSNVTATAERRESVAFSAEYFLNPQTILTRAEFIADPAAEEGYTKLSDLVGKRIGVKGGGLFDAYALAQWPDAQLSYYESSADLIMALQQGKIDAYLEDQPVARQNARTVPGVAYIEEVLSSDQYGFVFQKNDAGSKLQAEFNAFMANAEGGTLLEELDRIWYGDDEAQKAIPPAETLPATNGTIRYASDMQSAPFDYVENGQPVGADVDLITRFCQEMGYGLTIETASFGALLPGVAAGRYDAVAACISITEERAQSVHFSDPTYIGGVVAVVTAAEDTEEVKDGFFSSLAESFRKNFLVESRWKLIASGIGITLLLSVCSGLAGLVIGFGFCLLRMSRLRALDKTVTVITRILQGTPMVVLLMILYYIVFNKTGLSGVSVAIIAFGLNFGAYASEIMLSGIKAVDRGQREAAAAMGFTPAQTFMKIVFPQAARHFLPVLKGEYISLVKITSVVGYVAVQDLTKMSDIIRSRTYEAFFPLIVTAIIYFLLSYGLTSLLHLVEIRIDPKHRPRTLKGVNLK